jgi:TctA family transporter
MIKSGGALSGFFERPIAAGLGVVTLLVWVIPALMAIKRRHQG